MLSVSGGCCCDVLLCVDLLQLIRETENDDLTCALQRFVCTYSDEIAPLAIEVTKHLVCCCSVTGFILRDIYCVVLANVWCWRMDVKRMSHSLRVSLWTKIGWTVFPELGLLLYVPVSP